MRRWDVIKHQNYLPHYALWENFYVLYVHWYKLNSKLTTCSWDIAVWNIFILLINITIFIWTMGHMIDINRMQLDVWVLFIVLTEIKYTLGVFCSLQIFRIYWDVFYDLRATSHMTYKETWYVREKSKETQKLFRVIIKLSWSS